MTVDFIEIALLIFTVNRVTMATIKKPLNTKTIRNVNLEPLYIWAEFGTKWTKN